MLCHPSGDLPLRHDYALCAVFFAKRHLAERAKERWTEKEEERAYEARSCLGRRV